MVFPTYHAFRRRFPFGKSGISSPKSDLQREEAYLSRRDLSCAICPWIIRFKVVSHDVYWLKQVFRAALESPNRMPSILQGRTCMNLIITYVWSPGDGQWVSSLEYGTRRFQILAWDTPYFTLMLGESHVPSDPERDRYCKKLVDLAPTDGRWPMVRGLASAVQLSLLQMHVSLQFGQPFPSKTGCNILSGHNMQLAI